MIKKEIKKGNKREIKLNTLLVVIGLFLFVNTATVTGVSIQENVSSLIVNKLLSIASGLISEYSILDSQKRSSTWREGTDIANFNHKTKKLKLLSFGFNNLDNSGSSESSAITSRIDFEGVPAAVIGKALVYPNPFRQNSVKGGILGYELSKPMDVEIHVYDMMGHLIVKRTFNEGADGGNVGYNKLRLNEDLLEKTPLSAGVYFFLIMNNGALLKKGKMAVKP